MGLLAFLLKITILFSILVQKNIVEGIDLDFHQTDYNIQFERAEVDYFNKHYMNDFSITTFKFNRTSTAVNASFSYRKSNLILQKIMVLVQCYKFASNEYRFFPIRFQMGMCDMYDKNMAGMASALKCSHYQGCPVETGRNYKICNFTPDTSRFPPLIPNGRYKVELKAFINDSIDMWNFYILIEISRPLFK